MSDTKFTGMVRAGTLNSILSLVTVLLFGGTCLAQEFMIDEYRAYALLGEARFNKETDYISFTGDFGFRGSLPEDEVIARHLAHEARLLSKFSLSVINLEFPLTGLSGRELDRQIDHLAIDIMKEAGYDLVARANNHAFDYGLQGIRHNTVQLQRAGLRMIGTRDYPSYEWKTGEHRVAIYALTDSTDKEDSDGHILRIEHAHLAFISKQTSKAHFRIAFVHLGSASSFPSPHEREQIGALIDAGADLVICTGSHFIKGFAIESGKPVVYGIGNHLFSAMCCDIEHVGMHLVAGFRSGEFVQLLAIPFLNAYREGETGPLDEAEFSRFKAVLLERSGGNAAAYYSDPRTLKKLREVVSRFSFADVGKIKPRHSTYAIRIMLHHYPVVGSAALALALMLPALAVCLWVMMRRRRLAQHTLH